MAPNPVKEDSPSSKSKQKKTSSCLPKLPTKGSSVAPEASDKTPGKAGTSSAALTSSPSAVAARCAQPPVIAVRGSCTSSTGTSKPVGAPKIEPSEPAGVVFLYPPESLPMLVVSSWLVPTVKNPRKGIPTFVLSTVITLGLISYLFDSVISQIDLLSTCDSAAFNQWCALCVFANTLFSHHSSATVLQICLYSEWLKQDGEAKPDPTGIMRWSPSTLKAVRPTTPRGRKLLALVPLLDMLLELLVFVSGIVFLLTSENDTTLIINSVAVNFITDIDVLLLGTFFSKASRQRLSKYRFDHRFGVADGDTQLNEQTPHMQRYNKYIGQAPWALLVFNFFIVLIAHIQGRVAAEPGADSCRVFF